MRGALIQLMRTGAPRWRAERVAVQHERHAQLRGRGGEFGESVGEVRTLAGLKHDQARAREEDGPEAVRLLFCRPVARQCLIRGHLPPGFGEHG
jgi:hypothetical protein